MDDALVYGTDIVDLTFSESLEVSATFEYNDSILEDKKDRTVDLEVDMPGKVSKIKFKLNNILWQGVFLTWTVLYM